MERLLQVNRDEYVRAMRAKTDRIMARIMDAVNAAPDGHVINGSEVQVRDLMAELRQVAYETALQMRVDETEASFSPSAGRTATSDAKQGR